MPIHGFHAHLSMLPRSDFWERKDEKAYIILEGRIWRDRHRIWPDRRLIAVVIIAALTTLGSNLSNKFTEVSNNLT